MTLNNVKPRSGMKRFSRSTFSATDLLLNLVMTEDCALSDIGFLPSPGISFERSSAGLPDPRAYRSKGSPFCRGDRSTDTRASDQAPLAPHRERRTAP